MRNHLAATALAVVPSVTGSVPVSSTPFAGEAIRAPDLPARRGTATGYHYGATYTQILDGDGTFTRSDYASIFGEVYVAPSQRLCADMGNGKRAGKKSAARVRRVAFYDGPTVQLSRADSSDLENYGVRLTGDNSFRYGGPGAC